jgi:hypothetical protein
MIGFPLLLIPLAIYNIIVLLMPSVSFADPLVRLTLVSGSEWSVTLSDLLLALGILMLLLEVFKGARPGAKYLTDHLLSLILFGAAAAEFVLWPKFGTSTYFLLVLLAMADFLSGITLRARRPLQVAQGAGVSRQRVPAKTMARAAEPQFDRPPESAPTTPPATSVAESILRDRPEPSLPEPNLADVPEPSAPEPSHPEPSHPERSHPEQSPPQPAGASNAASPEVPSPELQPGNGTHPPPEAPSR